MAALAIPLGATFSRMHSSEQNAELINVSNARRKEDKLNDLLGNYLNYLKITMVNSMAMMIDLSSKKI